MGTATFARAAIFPIALASLISQAHSCEFNTDYFRSQNIIQGVQLMAIRPIIDEMISKSEKRIGYEIDYKNSIIAN